jgi:hypothetical protein
MFVFVFAMFGLVSTSKAEAACVVTGTGTWDGVAGAGGGGTAVFTGCVASHPAVDEAVIIPSNVTLTVSAGTPTIGALTIDNPSAGGANGLTINAGIPLIVTGAVTFTANTGTLAQTITLSGAAPSLTAGSVVMSGSSSSGTQSIVVGAGTLTAGGITITDGAGTGDILVSATTGIITTTSGVTFSSITEAIDAKLTISGAGFLNLNGSTGTLGTGGTATLDPASTTTFGGTGAQVMNTYTYGKVVINKSGGTGTVTIVPGGTATVGHTFTLTTGGFSTGTGTLTATAQATSIAADKTLTIASGGTATLASIAGTTTGAVSNAGTLTINGVTGIGAGGAITNSGTLVATGTITLGIAATVTNSGTFSAGGTFGDGNGVVINTGTLNLSGATTNALNVATVTADEAGTVVYDTGIQTIKAAAGGAGGYYNLTLSGTGAKSLPASTVVNNNLTISTSAAKITLLTSSLSTARKLYFGTSLQRSGTWGATAADANHETDTYFTAGITYLIDVAIGSSSSMGDPTTTTTTTTTTTITTTTEVTTTPVTCTLPQVLNTTTNTCVTPVTEPAGGCSGGNAYNTSTGALCVNNAGAEIPGCGNRNTGFSTASGTSCTGNRVVTAGTPNAPGASGYNFGTTTLKNGSRGEAVMELQRFLNAKLGLGLVVDGKLGPKTIKVIKQWQKDHDLVADGLVGAKTKAKMNAEAN